MRASKFSRDDLQVYTSILPCIEALICEDVPPFPPGLHEARSLLVKLPYADRCPLQCLLSITTLLLLGLHDNRNSINPILKKGKTVDLCV